MMSGFHLNMSARMLLSSAVKVPPQGCLHQFSHTTHAAQVDRQAGTTQTTQQANGQDKCTVARSHAERMSSSTKPNFLVSMSLPGTDMERHRGSTASTIRQP